MAIDCRRMLPAWAPPGRLTASHSAKRNQTALLTALGVDNFGSGLFLPLTLVYLTRDVGLPLNVAGPVISMGALAGLAVPAFTGRLVDRAGARSVVIASQVIQALGAVGYLLARSELPVLAAAMLLATGQQLFYSSLFALVSDVSGDGPPDRPFAVVNMVRAGCFGLGGLATGGLLTAAGPGIYRIAVAANGLSFLACAALLAWCVRVPWPPAPPPRPGPASSASPGSPASPAEPPQRTRPAGPLSDRPFLALIVLTGLVMLAVDFYLTGMPVYVIEQLHAPDWLPGTLLAVSTTLSSLAGTFALRMTGRLTRIAAIQAGAVLYVAWCGVSLAAILLPPAWRPADLMLAIVLLAAAGLVCGPRAGALAASVAPPQARGRYLAAFQYSFTGAGVLAPAVAALASVAVWLPWLLVATASGAAIGGLHWLTGRLPPHALVATEAAPVALPAESPASPGPSNSSSPTQSRPAAPQTDGPRRVAEVLTVTGHRGRLVHRPMSGRAHAGSVRLDRPGGRGLRRRATAGQGHASQH
jgi:MFS family permease